jgi:queuine tRNA-ribosyltransferase
VDMFDCVLPTRLGRNGSLFTDEGRANIRNARYKDEPGPLLPGCDCPACSRFSAAYLHHLFRNGELLGYRLATLHNLRYLASLMDRIRDSIRQDAYPAFALEFLARYRPTDEQVRSDQKALYARQRSGP